MTTIDLYRKHKAGDISREKFLYEVRRDNNLPFITNLTSYDDAVKILKNKGIVNEVDTKEAKADEAVKAEVKAKKISEKKPKTLHIDVANPYEYRHGLAHELDALGEYTDEALEKAKVTVLKNLAKDANFYSNLLNAEKSSYTFKETETDKPGMQAKADGYLKKELKKDEKTNVKDNLGKKEEGSKKPKGVKVMSDKGVTGSEKTIKEDIQTSTPEDQFNQLMSKYDWYAEFSDDSNKWSAQQRMEDTLKQLAKTIGADKAVEIYNSYAPSDRKVTSSHFLYEDKHSKIKEALKKKIKEVLSTTDIQNAKTSGKTINVSKVNSQDIKALQNAKANFTTYE